MRRTLLHLRQYLATHSLGPRLGAKVLKVGLGKVGGGAAVALAIPVAAVGTYAMPVSAIKQFASPIVGAAPDIFETRALAKAARDRFERAVEHTGPVADALGRASELVDPDPPAEEAAASAAPTGDEVVEIDVMSAGTDQPSPETAPLPPPADAIPLLSGDAGGGRTDGNITEAGDVEAEEQSAPVGSSEDERTAPDAGDTSPQQDADDNSGDQGATSNDGPAGEDTDPPPPPPPPPCDSDHNGDGHCDNGNGNGGNDGDGNGNGPPPPPPPPPPPAPPPPLPPPPPPPPPPVCDSDHNGDGHCDSGDGNDGNSGSGNGDGNGNGGGNDNGDGNGH